MDENWPLIPRVWSDRMLRRHYEQICAMPFKYPRDPVPLRRRLRIRLDDLREALALRIAPWLEP